MQLTQLEQQKLLRHLHTLAPKMRFVDMFNVRMKVNMQDPYVLDPGADAVSAGKANVIDLRATGYEFNVPRVWSLHDIASGILALPVVQPFVAEAASLSPALRRLLGIVRGSTEIDLLNGSIGDTIEANARVVKLQLALARDDSVTG